jgi:hypothetical protein
MKNAQLLIERADVHDFVASLWATDAFRISQREKGFVYSIVDQLAALPRLFCEASNDRLERAHFSTWWGAMMHRDDYTNPVIHDLYWLHEFYHAAFMPYIPGIGHVAHNEKMVRNELEASVLSEIQVYFEMPGLREVSFPHPIYADRYLTDPDMHALWRHNKQVAIEMLRMQRRNVMVSKPEHEMDMTERWIRKFAEQNAAYALVWADRYGEIEQRMYDFQLTVLKLGRREAIVRHRDWLEAECGGDSIDHVPFRQEAELATGFYWANKAKHQAAMRAEGARLAARAPVQAAPR